ncbi:hypothetical protein F0L68_34670 [Solihabitans fulvus]|uniref:Zinc finger protein n=1 Tax=Solihabitans fulvus TaxID=1892852 RepID=A0A5B2WQ58_9PSEU|nr:zinc finger protein [Solihabitans fulvus]KAA2252666.1 hypothetical protein F0L68_34670 [Solihabitans fulvus]
MTRPYRYVPVDGLRHAVERSVEPESVCEALCGHEIARVPTHWSATQGCWATCWRCEAMWREHEGIPPNTHVPQAALAAQARLLATTPLLLVLGRLALATTLGHGHARHRHAPHPYTVLLALRRVLGSFCPATPAEGSPRPQNRATRTGRREAPRA